ncbi:MAG: glycosyltransferase 87 family protein [Thermoleophilaceae bacterium]
MRRRLIAVIALGASVAALATALVAAQGGRGHLPLPAAQAARAALDDPTVAEQAAGHDRYRVTRLDARLDRVTFFAGPRIQAVAAVDTQGQVRHVQSFPPGAPRYGSKLSDSPWLLAALALCFLLATATAPLLSLRNLDVLALLAFLVPIVAADHQLFALSVLSGYPPLAYLCARCAWRAARGAGPPATPLLDLLPRPGRTTAYAIAAVAILLVVVATTSPGAIDVGFASSAGATLLLHGTLPYGHMPSDVLHGDTYPLLNYLLYLPAAAIAPVRDGFDDTSGALLIGLAGALVTAAALRRAGARTVLAWLSFPPLVIAVAAGTNDILLAAAIAIALAVASRPGRAALALAAGAWIKLAPLALLPLWLARTRGKPLLRAIGAAAALSAVLCAELAFFGGSDAFPRMLHALSFQLERGTLQSAWALLGIGPLQAVVQALALAGIAFAAVNARRLASDPARLAAATGAVLAALQLSASNWTYLYLLWLFPPVAVALLAPLGATPGRATPATRTGRPSAGRSR